MLKQGHNEENEVKLKNLQDIAKSENPSIDSIQNAAFEAEEMLAWLLDNHPLKKSFQEILVQLKEKLEIEKRILGISTAEAAGNYDYVIDTLENLITQGRTTLVDPRTGQTMPIAEMLAEANSRYLDYLQAKAMEYSEISKKALENGQFQAALNEIQEAKRFLARVDDRRRVDLKILSDIDHLESTINDWIRTRNETIHARDVVVDELSESLISKGLRVSTNVVIGETGADVYVLSPVGATFMLQVLNWEPTPMNKVFASNLAAAYKKLSKTDYVFVILPGSFKSDPNKNVLSSKEASDVIGIIFKQHNAVKTPPPTIRPKPKKAVFVAMPFSEKYFDTFIVGIETACLEFGASAVRVDHSKYAGDIVVEIKHSIEESIAVVADLSESKPNVFYEIGYAHALGRPVIQICSTSLEDLPFDIRNNKTISYKIGQTYKLKEELVNELKTVLH